MAVGDFVKEEFSDEEKAALGEVPDPNQKKDEDEGAGKSPEELAAEAKAKEDADVLAKANEADAKAKAEAGEKPKTEDKEDKSKESELDEKDKAAIAAEGVTVVTDEKTKKSYIVDADGEKIPATRWKKMYWESKTAKQEKEELTKKLDLFKQLGAEEYYKQFPKEKPADYVPKAKVEPEEDLSDFGSRIVKGGIYDGKTVDEVAAENPLHAQLILNNYLEAKRTARAQAEADERRKVEEADQNFETEKRQFVINRGKEFFGKESGFTQAEINQINESFAELAAWMDKENRIRYSLEDAYLVKNYEKTLQKERVKASEAVMKKMAEKGAISIGAGDGAAKPSGFETYMEMSEDKLAKVIDGFSDKDQKEFYSKAPPELRNKYPTLPWERPTA